MPPSLYHYHHHHTGVSSSSSALVLHLHLFNFFCTELETLTNPYSIHRDTMWHPIITNCTANLTFSFPFSQRYILFSIHLFILFYLLYFSFFVYIKLVFVWQFALFRWSIWIKNRFYLLYRALLPTLKTLIDLFIMIFINFLGNFGV